MADYMHTLCQYCNSFKFHNSNLCMTKLLYQSRIFSTSPALCFLLALRMKSFLELIGPVKFLMQFVGWYPDLNNHGSKQCYKQCWVAMQLRAQPQNKIDQTIWWDWENLGWNGHIQEGGKGDEEGVPFQERPPARSWTWSKCWALYSPCILMHLPSGNIRQHVASSFSFPRTSSGSWTSLLQSICLAHCWQIEISAAGNPGPVHLSSWTSCSNKQLSYHAPKWWIVKSQPSSVSSLPQHCLLC